MAIASLDRRGVGHWGMVGLVGGGVLGAWTICLRFIGVLSGIGGAICVYIWGI